MEKPVLHMWKNPHEDMHECIYSYGISTLSTLFSYIKALVLLKKAILCGKLTVDEILCMKVFHICFECGKRGQSVRKMLENMWKLLKLFMPGL